MGGFDLFNIILPVLLYALIFLSFLVLIGIESVLWFLNKLREMKNGDKNILKKFFIDFKEYIKIIFHEMPWYSRIVYVGVFFLFFLTMLFALINLCNISIFYLFFIALLLSGLIFLILLVLVYKLLTKIFDFIDEHKNEFATESIIVFTTLISSGFLFYFYAVKNYFNIKISENVLILFFVVFLSSNVLIWKCMFRVIISGNPFKTTNMLERKIWQEAIWWLVLLVTCCFFEVWVCYSSEHIAFVFENNMARNINIMDLLYFTLGTFLSTDTFYLEPNSLKSKIATLIILFSSVIYIGVFISSILSVTVSREGETSVSQFGDAFNCENKKIIEKIRNSYLD